MIDRLFYLLSALVEYLKRAARKRKQEAEQHERDELEDNPADWYRDEFGGMQRDNADSATEADSSRDREK